MRIVVDPWAPTNERPNSWRNESPALVAEQVGWVTSDVRPWFEVYALTAWLDICQTLYGRAFLLEEKT